jgi:hypothetical protein
MDKIKQKEREWLMEQKQFHNFLFDLLESSSICIVTRDEPSALFFEGRRSLGLEILGWFGEKLDPLHTISVISRNQFQPKGKLDDRSDST